MMDHNERVIAMLKSLAASLSSSQLTLDLLIEELLDDAAIEGTGDGSGTAGEHAEDVELIEGVKVGNEDPELCDHPSFLTAMDQRLCTSCGRNLDVPYD